MQPRVTFSILTWLCAVAAVHADITYNGFADTTGLTINGHAFTTSNSDGTVLRLTPSMNDRGGSGFSTAQVSTSEFISIFSFRIGNNGGAIFDNNTRNGADGIAFLIQNQANNVGGIGGGIGYMGISPSLAVEFDTWGNGLAGDPSQSHIGITINGNIYHTAPGQGPTANIGNTNAPTTALPGPELDDGVRWWSWVVYDGTTLQVYLEQNNSVLEPTMPSTPLLSFNVDLESILGGTTAFAGFTASTGAAWSDHDIIYWRYTEAIPEPSTLLLLAAVAGFVLMYRVMPRARSRIIK